MDRVLVAYATKNGSTEQVAQAIGEALRQRDATVTIASAGHLRAPVDGYDLVVLGGALYSGRWHSGAHRFLRRHRGELATVPVAVFGMGPRDDAEPAWQRARAQLDRALSKRAWLNPVAVTVFGGVDPPRKQPRRDIRDWAAIRTWAETAIDDVRSRRDAPTT